MKNWINSWEKALFLNYQGLSIHNYYWLRLSSSSSCFWVRERRSVDSRTSFHRLIVSSNREFFSSSPSVLFFDPVRCFDHCLQTDQKNILGLQDPRVSFGESSRKFSVHDWVFLTCLFAYTDLFRILFWISFRCSILRISSRYVNWSS